MTRILHLSAHLGGGVGRALESVVRADADGARAHRVVCLEPPQKTAALEALERLGCPVVIAPTARELGEEIARADLVQLEYWNHPATLHALCATPLPAMRLVTWCHVSGLHFPRIAPAMIAASSRFLLTSACSWQAPELAALPAALRERVSVVSSAAGLESLPIPQRDTSSGGACRFGYLGSLNFAKLHPDLVHWLSAIDEPGFELALIGDTLNRDTLQAQCRRIGREGMLRFDGFAPDPITRLAGLDVLVYLLNPCHYGTAEIALLEAMAMGVVPVVLPNPAERAIVEHGHTGLIVDSPAQLAQAVSRLARDPAARRAIGERAARQVRSAHTLARLREAFAVHYDAALREPRRVIDFPAALGAGPAEWFRGFVREAEIYPDAGRVRLPRGAQAFAHRERTKGSVRHFHQHFVADPRLERWARDVEEEVATS